MGEDYYTIKEVSRKLHIPVKRVRFLLMEGKLECVEYKNFSYRISEKSLSNYIRSVEGKEDESE